LSHADFSSQNPCNRHLPLTSSCEFVSIALPE
jgi:hypothetical protein